MFGTSTLPKITKHSTHETTVEIGGKTFYFSYETCVAFLDPRTDGLVVSENVWSVTTGKHLTHLDGGSKEAKARRLPHDEFVKALEKATTRLPLY